MKSSFSTSILQLLLLLTPATIEAFSVTPAKLLGSSSTTSASKNNESALSAAAGESESSRRTMLTNSFMTSSAVIMGLMNLMNLPSPAFAEEMVDDLAMPSADEEAKAKAEMEERIRKKMELQKKAAKPATFAESLEKEKAKKAELAKSKEERRNALCEELGRGC